MKKVDYDYLINATGPHLNFEGTEGLGPDNGTTNRFVIFTMRKWQGMRIWSK